MKSKRLPPRWQDLGSLAVGVWLLVSPWFINLTNENSLVWSESSYVALAIIAMSIFAICLPNIWTEVLIFGTAAWMISAPLVIRLDVTEPDQRLGQIMMIDSVLTSLFLLIFSLWVIFDDTRLKKMFHKNY